MPTTTNYGWTTPADTDLVKDGASAIRTLGTAIDTTVFTNAGNAINKTIVDAKGDLIVGTAADTVARLAVGATNGHVLTVDSSTASGLKWDAAPSGKLLQVVTGTTTTTTSIASTTLTDTGLTATITPTSATSKILVLVCQQFRKFRSSAIQGVGISILRGSTNIYNGTDQLSWHNFSGVTDIQFDDLMTISYVDSPSTTSSTTYKTQGEVWSTANAGSVDFQSANRVSTITLLEIGA